MRIFNIIFIVLFIIAAGLQYNDPDPWLWVPIYLYAAMLCFLTIRGRYNVFMYLAGITFYSAYAIRLGLVGVRSWVREHDAENLVQTMKAEKPWIEESREFFGLLIVIAVLAANMIWAGRMRKRTEKIT
jgi:hypothetical protein